MSNEKEVRILKLISLIRWSHHSIEKIYTQGGCFQFYKILKIVFPDAIPCHANGHVCAKIDGKYYDINGEEEPSRDSEKEIIEMDEAYQEKAEQWVRNAYNKDYLFEKEETAK